MRAKPLQRNFTFSNLALINIIVLTCVFIQASLVSAQSSNNNPTTTTSRQNRKQILDSAMGYNFEWVIDRTKNIITCNIEAKNNGYLALGMSKNGQLNGSDVIIFGFGKDGKPYVSDMNGGPNNRIIRDIKQDWRLISANRSSGRTMMSLQRNIDTCDTQDFVLSDDLIHLIWGYGNGTDVPSELEIQGSVPVYIMDVIGPPEQNVQTWRMSRTFRVPPRHTSYWCTMHKRNVSLQAKHHVIGFSAYFGNELARQHVHHQLVYRCITPPGANAETLFEKFLNHPGEECYLNENPQLPSAFCREIIHEWAVGGTPFLFPEEIGLPLGEFENEYFMYETHYNNPEIRSDLDLETGVDFYYTPELRPNDGSILILGHGTLGTFGMPPNTPSFNVVGHCSPKCTEGMVPLTGVDILVAKLHGHYSARRMRLRHYRGNSELPWILNDQNYDFNYQQYRYLINPVKLLPGDQLTVQCGLDNTWMNGSATVSGFSTKDEMCMGFVVLNRRLPYLYCSSEYPTERSLEKFGIRNMTWEVNSHERVIHVADDPRNVGRLFSQVVGNFSEWTPQQKLDLEREQMYSEHDGACPNLRLLGTVAYYTGLLEELTGGLVELPLVADSVPTTRTLSTPFPTTKVRYPTEASVYMPPQCPATSSQDNASNNPTPNAPVGSSSDSTSNSNIPSNNAAPGTQDTAYRPPGFANSWQAPGLGGNTRLRPKSFGNGQQPRRFGRPRGY